MHEALRLANEAPPYLLVSHSSGALNNLIFTDLFKNVAEMAITAKARRTKENADFLSFFRDVVETVPTEAALLFGSLSNVEVIKNGQKQTFEIELTAIDYIWWKNELEGGVHFVKPVRDVKMDMLEHLAKKAAADRAARTGREIMAKLKMPDGFTAFSGTTRPVGEHEFVEVLVRTVEGFGSSGIMRANLFDWNSQGMGGVVGYRSANAGEDAKIDRFERGSSPARLKTKEEKNSGS